MVLLQNWPSSDRRAKEPLPGIPWAKYRPPLDVLLAHRGRVGIIPASLHSTAIDLDRGNPQFLPPGWVEYRSRRPGGRHLWYQETQQFKDCAWESKGCSGDVRSKGYLIPWHDGLSRIAKALVEGRQMSLFPFPTEFLRGFPVELHDPDKEKRSAPVPRSLWYGLPLELVRRGARNTALFEALRLWSYRQRRGSSLADWKSRVLEHGHILNRRFPEPFAGREERQIKDNAYSVSVWCWRNLKWELDHSPARQAARGRSSGSSRREGTALEHDRKPWEAEGICRATWYNRKRPT